MFDFSGKNALITGAASGIGRATAEYFHGCGANVVLADINAAALAALAKGLNASGARAVVAVYNAADPASVQGVIDTATAAFGKLDYLVASAGINEGAHAAEMTDEQWRRTLSVNLDGVFYITRRAIPVMNDGGAIVTLASVSAHKGGSFEHAHYGATKGGILAYTRGLARDLGPHLRANSVSPGIIDTPMLDAHPAGRNKAGPKPDIPLGRYGRASEVASVIAFLCSDAASYVTGETILITGGQYMG